VNVAPETCRAKTEKNKLDLLHLFGILFINPRCTETRNSISDVFTALLLLYLKFVNNFEKETEDESISSTSFHVLHKTL
jgi:hypothetical protein